MYIYVKDFIQSSKNWQIWKKILKINMKWNIFGPADQMRQIPYLHTNLRTPLLVQILKAISTTEAVSINEGGNVITANQCPRRH